jgi:CRP-like cAMP-binding protein
MIDKETFRDMLERFPGIYSEMRGLVIEREQLNEYTITQGIYSGPKISVVQLLQRVLSGLPNKINKKKHKTTMITDNRTLEMLKNSLFLNS